MISNKNKRAIYIDLDFIHDNSAAQVDANIHCLLKRLDAVRPNMLCIPAFGGNQKQAPLNLYYRNSVLGQTKGQDLLAKVIDRIRQVFHDTIAIFVWMPTLSLDIEGLPYVKIANADNEAVPSEEGYRRLTPFNKKVRATLKTLYREMAQSVSTVDGIMIHDDLILNDREDVSRYGLAAMKKAGFGDTVESACDEDTRAERAEFKINYLNDFAGELIDEVRAVHGQQVKSARNTFASTLVSQESIEQFSQDLALCLPAYDYLAPMVMPYMEGVSKERHAQFFRDMVAAVKRHDGLEKTLFTLQAMNWASEAQRQQGKQSRWIDGKEMAGWMQQILDLGGQHYGYYPDEFIAEQQSPEARVIRPYMTNV